MIFYHCLLIMTVILYVVTNEYNIIVGQNKMHPHEGSSTHKPAQHKREGTAGTSGNDVPLGIGPERRNVSWPPVGILAESSLGFFVYLNRRIPCVGGGVAYFNFAAALTLCIGGTGGRGGTTDKQTALAPTEKLSPDTSIDWKLLSCGKAQSTTHHKPRALDSLAIFYQASRPDAGQSSIINKAEVSRSRYPALVREDSWPMPKLSMHAENVASRGRKRKTAPQTCRIVG
ncbi:uncharacterized protein H6S33_008327 [Morchella sextelata]|uniref:uncharacterized protein n=1 Tax=Morchella sextelata TaxID=1174677 RepID=UPI001D059160|nr:uncharacterized protein H6S33_008327 [Morchella sextelata]KAH0602677.1 hypothetical protein H6S33_008327 [Morchella sextelata]